MRTCMHFASRTSRASVVERRRRRHVCGNVLRKTDDKAALGAYPFHGAITTAERRKRQEKSLLIATPRIAAMARRRLRRGDRTCASDIRFTCVACVQVARRTLSLVARLARRTHRSTEKSQRWRKSTRLEQDASIPRSVLPNVYCVVVRSDVAPSPSSALMSINACLSLKNVKL